jgi:hypothetical protein
MLEKFNESKAVASAKEATKRSVAAQRQCCQLIVVC